MPFLERGKLYRFKGTGWLQKSSGPITDILEGDWRWVEFKHSKPIGTIELDAVVMFIEQSTKHPYTYKIIHGDQIGWVVGYPEQFEEFSDAEAEKGVDQV